ncbi:hypothetical protein [Tateyamaria omphalii]|uniref:hypothetical protein n=1 Tax=Tateyamaria omphalii TaxID=299262 RepID=UPI00167A5A50|nr:hypothetical protein [Tateyamaria omphalii]
MLAFVLGLLCLLLCFGEARDPDPGEDTEVNAVALGFLGVVLIAVSVLVVGLPPLILEVAK